MVANDHAKTSKDVVRMKNDQDKMAEDGAEMVKVKAEKEITKVEVPTTKSTKMPDAEMACTETMKTKAANAKKAQTITAEGGCGIPGVHTSNKAAEMDVRAQGLGARAHTASAAATPPDGNVEMVGSQLTTSAS